MKFNLHGLLLKYKIKRFPPCKYYINEFLYINYDLLYYGRLEVNPQFLSDSVSVFWYPIDSKRSNIIHPSDQSSSCHWILFAGLYIKGMGMQK